MPGALMECYVTAKKGGIADIGDKLGKAVEKQLTDTLGSDASVDVSAQAVEKPDGSQTQISLLVKIGSNMGDAEEAFFDKVEAAHADLEKALEATILPGLDIGGSHVEAFVEFDASSGQLSDDDSPF